jgi:hypothetical protein
MWWAQLLNVIAAIHGTGVAAATNSYESIATVSVGSGGASDITFSSIPSTFKHLQIRGIARSDVANSDIESLAIRLNSDSGSNYAYHLLQGNGATASAAGASSVAAGIVGAEPGNSHTSGIFGGYVIDILDYANTSKTKTIRSLGGVDTNNNGTEKGQVRLSSTLWNSTTAVNQITLKNGGTFVRGFVQYSSFALYGIKG